MLAGIMMLLQDGVQPQPPKPMIKIDRGGGGGMRYPAFEIVDYVDASRSFREIPGEDTVVRAVRRANHIFERLTEAKRAKKQDEAGNAYAFLLGAELQRRVEESERAVMADQIAQLRTDYNRVIAQRDAAAVSPAMMAGARGDDGIGLGTVFVALGAAAVIAIIASRMARA